MTFALRFSHLLVLAVLLTACSAPPSPVEPEPVTAAPAALWDFRTCQASGNTYDWAINGCGFAEELCGGVASPPGWPDDLLTQWGDGDLHPGTTGLPSACAACLASACSDKLDACESATCP